MKRWTAISVAALVLVANSGLTMNTHFCGDQLVGSKLYMGIAHLRCSMLGMSTNCDNAPHRKEGVQPKSCCKNQHQVLQFDEGTKVSPLTVAASYPTWLVAFAHSLVKAPVAFISPTGKHPGDPPFFLNRDIRVLFQSLLI